MTHDDLKKQFHPGLFWDVEKIDPTLHDSFVISRILEEGDASDVRNLFSLYSENKIKETVLTSRRIGDRTRQFWQACFK
ncbi:hypothetical protein GF406_15010 [candidate division KSB1 bacterium]|nr:hypothetical protein [candidate division KSB1 bacterium]